MYTFAYLTLCLMLGVVWVLIFFLRKDLRKQMLVCSFLVAPFGITAIIYYNEYWAPQYYFPRLGGRLGLEDFILCFLYGGVSAVAYEFFRFRKLKIARATPVKKTEFVSALTFGVVTFLCFDLLNLSNVIYTTSLGLIMVGVVSVFYNPSLLKPALLNGLIFSVIMVFFVWVLNWVYPGVINSWWSTENLSGIYIFKVPAEEFLWHFSLGFAFGPVYDLVFSNGYKSL